MQQSSDPAPSQGQENPRNREKEEKDESGGSPPSAEMLQHSLHRLPLVHVRIKDLESLDGFGERGPCDVCNGRYVHYIERLTKERERTKRSAFRMCRSCHARAQQREAARCIALPGTVNVAGMRKWSVPLGRCHLCDTGPIVWFDPVDHFGVCETCYAWESAAVRDRDLREHRERATGVGLS